MTKKKLFKREWISGYIFIAPMVFGTLIFGIIPVLYSIGLSFVKWDGLGEKVFVGLNNFINLFQDDKFL